MSSHPLANIRIAITRAVHQAPAQRELLEAAGATVFHYPCIAIVPPQKSEALDETLKKALAGGYDWLLITSANTVYALAQRLHSLGQTLTEIDSMQVAAVGSSTAEAIHDQLGITVSAIPAEYTARALGDAIPDLNQSRVFLPQSAIAQSDLIQSLRDQGAVVDAVDAYRTAIAQGGDDVPSMLWEGSIDAITFTSASTVRNFAKRLSIENATIAMLDHVCVACIGPSTAEAAQQFGLNVSVMPAEHTIEGLTDGLVAYFQEEV